MSGVRLEGCADEAALGRVQRFEDLIAWQKARTLNSRIYALTKTGPLARDFSLKDQLRRAATSIMGNIAEGFERHGLKEFHRFLCITKASAGEVRSHLYVALDAGYINEEPFQELYSACSEVGRIIGGLRASIEGRIA